MKRIIFLLLLLAFPSCSNKSFTTNIDFQLYKSALTTTKSLQVSVDDNRPNKYIVGQKLFGDNAADIFIKQNIVSLLQSKITDNLVAKGFSIGSDFLIKISLENFNYTSRRGFFTGRSEGHGEIKVVVIDNANGHQFIKNYETHSKKTYFIVSSEEEDRENINNLMQNLISGFLVDQEFLDHLKIHNFNEFNLDKMLSRMYMFM